MSLKTMRILSFLWLVFCVTTAEVTTQSASDTLHRHNKTTATTSTEAGPSNPGRLATHPLHLTGHHEHHHSENFTNFVRIANVLDIFNIEDVARVWHEHDTEFNHNCSKHMKEYFHGLQRGHLWAVKSKFDLFLY